MKQVDSELFATYVKHFGYLIPKEIHHHEGMRKEASATILLPSLKQGNFSGPILHISGMTVLGAEPCGFQHSKWAP